MTELDDRLMRLELLRVHIDHALDRRDRWSFYLLARRWRRVRRELAKRG